MVNREAICPGGVTQLGAHWADEEQFGDSSSEFERSREARRRGLWLGKQDCVF